MQKYMESQKTKNCQSNPEEKEQCLRNNPPRLQIILQSDSSQMAGISTKTDTQINGTESPEINLQQKR